MSPTRRDMFKVFAGAITAALAVKATVAGVSPEPLRIESLPHGAVMAELSDGRHVTLVWVGDTVDFCIGRLGAMHSLDPSDVGEVARKQNEVLIWLALQQLGIDIASDVIPAHVTYDTL